MPSGVVIDRYLVLWLLHIRQRDTKAGARPYFAPITQLYELYLAASLEKNLKVGAGIFYTLEL
jgi:hypothetical protein